MKVRMRTQTCHENKHENHANPLHTVPLENGP